MLIFNLNPGKDAFHRVPLFRPGNVGDAVERVLTGKFAQFEKSFMASANLRAPLHAIAWLLIIFCLAESSLADSPAAAEQSNELWWSLKPLKKPEVPPAPAGKYKSWPRTSVGRR